MTAPALVPAPACPPDSARRARDLTRLVVDPPDHILADVTTLGSLMDQPRRTGRPPVADFPLVFHVIRWLTVRAARVEVLLPDVLLAQLVWGARTAARPWPRHWGRALKRLPVVGGRWTGACGPACPVHGSALAHGHFRVRATEYNSGEVTGLARDPGTGDQTLDLAAPPKDGNLRAVYLPALLVGASRRSGLTARQGLLLSLLAGQVTRSREKNRRTRPDKAQVFTAAGGAAADGAWEAPVMGCPFLTPGTRYVAFNGNAGRRMKGRHGYGLKVKTRATAAGYKQASAYLTDLAALAGPFGLTVGGYDRDTRLWYTPAQMVQLGAAAGGLLLRVYTAPDYLPRWRADLFGRLGLVPGDGAADRVATAADVARKRAAARRPGPATVLPPPPPPQPADVIAAVRRLTTPLAIWMQGHEGERLDRLFRQQTGHLPHAVGRYYLAVLFGVPGFAAEVEAAARREVAAHPAAWEAILGQLAAGAAEESPARQVFARLREGSRGPGAGPPSRTPTDEPGSQPAA